MIHIKFKGRFGNHLFQMSCANFLSKKFMQPISSNWNNILLQNKNDNKTFQNSIIVNNDNIHSVFNQEENNFNLILDDYFQTRYCINKFIEYNTYKNNSNELKDSTFVHLRLGDIKNIVSLDYDYYDKAINDLGGKNVILSSDSPDDEIVTKLKNKHKAKMFFGDESETILMGANCKNRILSLGTFSWWIGFLGNIFWQDSVSTICPKVDRVRKWHGDIFPIFNWREV